METKLPLLAMLLFLPLLLVAGLIWLESLNWRTRSWRTTNGRISSSVSEAREIRKKDFHDDGGSQHQHFVTEEILETRNYAVLRYEFKVDGLTYVGSRIDLSAQDGHEEVAQTLRRYPAGKIVPVIYDPLDPNRCILERLDPAKLRAGWAVALVLIGLVFGGVYGGEQLVEVLRARIPAPDHTPFVVFFAVFTLMLLAFARAISLKARAMRDWPSAPGTVTRSEVATTERVDSGPSRTTYQTMYVPRVVYRYRVGDTDFDGDNIGAIVTASVPGPAEKRIARFPRDMKVKVFYNPETPTESALDISVGYAPMVLRGLAAAFFVATLWIAGWTPHL